VVRLVEEHDAGCKAWSLFGAGCDCGATQAATRRIIDETCVKFGAELRQIMAADDHCDRCAGPCLRRPRHGQGWA